jgi:hypothetical protein
MSNAYDPNQHQATQNRPDYVQYQNLPHFQGQQYPHQQIIVQTENGNNTSLAPVTALVIGLLALMTAWIPIVGIVAWVFAPLAILFGVLGLRRGKAEHKIMSVIGLVCGGIALLCCFGYLALFVVSALSGAANA